MIVAVASVAALTLQRSLAAIGISSVAEQGAEQPHMATLIFFSDVVQFLLCALLVLREDGGRTGPAAVLRRLTLSHETRQVLVPGIFRAAEAFVYFLALANMDAVSYSCLGQTKILFAAFFTRVILKQQLAAPQYAALVTLLVGAVLTQLTFSRGGGGTAAAHGGSFAVGAAACLCVSVLSTFYAVVMERVLKDGPPTSPMVRAAQTAFIGIPLSLVGVFLFDVQRSPAPFHFLRGYDSPHTWLVVALSSTGGVLVLLVVNHTSNLWRTFASCMSIVLNMALLFVFWGKVPVWNVVAGSALIVASVVSFQRWAR
jgi:drug/metabolite transporter (DMT)-like permease